MVRRPDGSYLVAHTGDNISLKTSANGTRVILATCTGGDHQQWSF
ncbi:hypothetical protein ABJI51_40340 [Amycolatopsis sp. NEAU-NG30]|uniref:Ricin B lectin domain-containing protein n=1 Tax=Amycolatopsis melonis TaxID=3156488 RepID=A0ABV0LSS6_9PSEU